MCEGESQMFEQMENMLKENQKELVLAERDGWNNDTIYYDRGEFKLTRWRKIENGGWTASGYTDETIAGVVVQALFGSDFEKL